jgi:hypothetical protein
MSVIRIVCWIMAACRLAGSYRLSDEHAASNFTKNNIQTVSFFLILSLSFRLVANVVNFLLGKTPASVFC